MTCLYVRVRDREYVYERERVCVCVCVCVCVREIERERERERVWVYESMITLMYTCINILSNESCFIQLLLAFYLIYVSIYIGLAHR